MFGSETSPVIANFEVLIELLKCIIIYILHLCFKMKLGFIQSC